MIFKHGSGNRGTDLESEKMKITHISRGCGCVLMMYITLIRTNLNVIQLQMHNIHEHNNTGTSTCIWTYSIICSRWCLFFGCGISTVEHKKTEQTWTYKCIYTTRIINQIPWHLHTAMWHATYDVWYNIVYDITSQPWNVHGVYCKKRYGVVRLDCSPLNGNETSAAIIDNNNTMNMINNVIWSYTTIST
jgi:hypothetical protein